MKTKVKTNKLPRARVFLTRPYCMRPDGNLLKAWRPEAVDKCNPEWTTPVLVLPQPSLSAAKKGLALVNKYGVEALLKEPSQWAKLGEEEKVDHIRGILLSRPYPECVQAILQLLGKGAKG